MDVLTFDIRRTMLILFFSKHSASAVTAVVSSVKSGKRFICAVGLSTRTSPPSEASWKENVIAKKCAAAQTAAWNEPNKWKNGIYKKIQRNEMKIKTSKTTRISGWFQQPADKRIRTRKIKSDYRGFQGSVWPSHRLWNNLWGFCASHGAVTGISFKNFSTSGQRQRHPGSKLTHDFLPQKATVGWPRCTGMHQRTAEQKPLTD